MKKTALVLLAILVVFSLCSCNNAAAITNPAYDLGMQALSIIDDYKDGKINAKDAVSKIRSTVAGEFTKIYKDKTEQEKADIRRIDLAMADIMNDIGSPIREKFYKENEGMRKEYDIKFNIEYMQLRRELGLITGRLDGMNAMTYELGVQALDIYEKYQNGQVEASDALSKLENITKSLVSEEQRIRDQKNLQGAYTDLPEIHAIRIIHDDFSRLNSIIKDDSHMKRNTSNKFHYIAWYDRLRNHLGN